MQITCIRNSIVAAALLGCLGAAIISGGCDEASESATRDAGRAGASGPATPEAAGRPQESSGEEKTGVDRRRSTDPDRDLVCFIARFKPFLYRLVGAHAIPWGSARFYDPTGIVADRKRGCFWVLDRPMKSDQPVRIWRIAPDGAARIVYQRQFGLETRLLALGPSGRLLVGDHDMGLWREEGDGEFRWAVRDRRPLRRITAAAVGRDGALLVGCSYLHETRGMKDPNKGGTLGPLTEKSQGALLRVDLGRKPIGVQPLLANREPGGKEIDTYWRLLRQVFVDGAGRTLLVDAGGSFRHEELEFLGTPAALHSTKLMFRRSRAEALYSRTAGTHTEHIRKRVNAAEIDGGVLVMHPDGKLEDLTFKNPEKRRGLLWRPQGAAEWAPGVYLIADPNMYAPGMNGAGGLLLLSLDGSRRSRWRFGWRRKPIGVAILARDQADARTALPPPLRVAHLAGSYRAGAVQNVVRAAYARIEHRKQPGILGRMTKKTVAQPRAAAVQRLQQLFAGARWRVGPSGAVEVCLAGANPNQRRPEVMRGRCRIEYSAGLVGASNVAATDTDPSVCRLQATLVRSAANRVRLHVHYMSLVKAEAVDGEFDQVLTLAGKRVLPDVPAQPIAAGDLVGTFRAGRLTRITRAAGRKRVLAGRPGSPSYGLYHEWVAHPADRCAAELRSLLEGSRWELTRDGNLRFTSAAPAGRNRRPNATAGRYHLEGHTADFDTLNKFRGPTDSAVLLLAGTLEPRGSGLRVGGMLTLSVGNEKLEAEFELDLSRTEPGR